MSKTQGANPNLESDQSIISIPSQIEPQIPPQYWGTETGTILAIAILIRSIAVLIQALVPLIGCKSDAKADSR
ncbi:MAG: hypothetical protein AB1589_06945 [Cyanobacteriota bacterium]